MVGVVVDDAALAKGLGDYYGYQADELLAAKEALNLSSTDVVVRLTELAKFSKAYGVSPSELARFLADRGTGAAPIERRPSNLTESQWATVRREVPDGDWASAILRLLERLQASG